MSWGQKIINVTSLVTFCIIDHEIIKSKWIKIMINKQNKISVTLFKHMHCNY